MSMEQNIFDKHYEVYRNLEGNPPIPLLAKDCIVSAMRELARERAIGFHKFINSQSYHYDYRSETFNRISDTNHYTHDQLYDLYLSQRKIKAMTESEIKEYVLNPSYDWATDELLPCLCGYKPTYYSIYYSRTPYCVWCPHCKKQTNLGKCKVTGHHDNVIDYWNNHIRSITNEQLDAEVKEFDIEKHAIESREGMRAREYAYYWEKGKGEVLYQRW